MIDLFFAPTPNGWKATIMLEECELPYRLHLVNIAAGEQFSDAFLALSPNAKIPAIRDTSVQGDPVSVFETGTILQYLAEKTGKFLSADHALRFQQLQWLYWQVANLGPMGGQVSHFVNYATDGNDYSRSRYLNEYDRLLAVMDAELSRHRYLGSDEYSIADMASFPWLLPLKHYGFDLANYPSLKRWWDELKQRPALRRGVDVGKEQVPSQPLDEEARSVLFNQTSKNMRTEKNGE